MNIVKELKVQEETIEVRLEKGYVINDYQIQVMSRDHQYLSIRKDKRSKTHLFFNTEHTCSFRTYFQKTILEENPFIKLLIDVLELIQRITTEYFAVITLDSVVFLRDGTLALLTLPILKEEFISNDEEVREFLIDIIKYVQLQGGNTVIGLLVNQVKHNLHTTSLLQELYAQLPVAKEPSLFERLFWKQPPHEEITYPLPTLVSKQLHRRNYIEEIEEDDVEKTRMLFQTQSEGYLEYDHQILDIANDTFTIGRKSDRDCYLHAPAVSKEHAVIVKEEDGYYLTDLKSSNATYVNGKKLTPLKSVILHDGDEIKFADTSLLFHERK